MQNIRVEGNHAGNTHFAQVMIEADYRMKLIGIGLERPSVQIKSYVDAAESFAGEPQRVASVGTSCPTMGACGWRQDELGMELVGNGVKLVGGRPAMAQRRQPGRSPGRTIKASQTFVNGFTQKYAELAIAVPVYAEMRNCVDLAVAAAFIQKHYYYGKAGWSLGLFGSEQAVSGRRLNLPQHTDTVVASVWRGNHLMTPIGGGVTMHPRQPLEASNPLPDEEAKVAKTREGVAIRN